MSSLGPIQYEEPEGSVFLGRDYTKSKFTSDALSNEIDTEVRKIITSAQKEAKKRAKYQENINYIYSRKHVFEFYMVWIQHLFSKSQGDSKLVKVNSLLCDSQINERYLNEQF